jgi:hypothetical protein
VDGVTGINTLLYNGPTNKTFKIGASASLTAATASDVLGITIGVNGTGLARAQQAAVAAAQIGLTTSTLCTLTNGDKIGVMVENRTAARNATLTDVSLTVTEA